MKITLIPADIDQVLGLLLLRLQRRSFNIFFETLVALTNKMVCAKMMCDIEHFCKKNTIVKIICSNVANYFFQVVTDLDMLELAN